MGLCAPWSTQDDLCGSCSGLYTIDDALMEQKLLEASELLFQLSGQQFTGSCTDTVRVCSASYYADFYHSSSPLPRSGYIVGCGCSDIYRCNCSELQSIELLDFTTAITSVKIDGVTVPTGDYQLRGNRLVRLGGDAWPCCGEMVIELVHGVAPPQSGVTAAAVLACELYLLCAPDDEDLPKCRLPRNVTAVARQGVSVIFQTLVTPGRPLRFGLLEIDAFLEAFGNDGHVRSAILSPDVDDISFERVP